MPRRGQHTTFQERLTIGERAAAGQPDPVIARALGCSVWTVRKWRRILQRAGRGGLATRLGRPATGPLSTLSSDLRARLRQIREAHPGWGPQTILASLQTDPTWSEQPLPSRARVAAFLKQAGLTRRYQRHTALPQAPRQRPHAPHEEWQVDAQGAMRVDGIGLVSLINVIDVASRLKVESCPRDHCRKPAAADYFVTLRRAFLSYGLPARLSLDHDTVFFDNTTLSPFPTRLHLWLVALGIDVIFTRKRCPTDHAQIERTHQTMTRQALLGPTYPDQATLWAELDERRALLNGFVPARAFAQAPLQVYPDAAHSGHPYRPEWEEDLLDLERVFAYLAQGHWFRTVKPNGVFELGGYGYYLGKRWAERSIEIHCDPVQGTFVCQPEGSDLSLSLPPQGLSKADLMGDLATIRALPAYQLAFPCFVDDWRHSELARLLAGTTS